MDNLKTVCKEWHISEEEIIHLIENHKFEEDEVQVHNGEYDIKRTALLRVLGTKDIYRGGQRDQLAFSIIRYNQEIILYAPEYISTTTKQLAEKVARELVIAGEITDATEQVLMSVYINHTPNETYCQTERVCTHHKKGVFDMVEYEELTERIIKDWKKKINYSTI